MVSRSGKASRFSEDKVRAMGRDTSGVRGMNVSDTIDGSPNRVLAMDIARPETDVFVVTENGYGKRTAIEDYPVKGRGGQGVINIRAGGRNGKVVGIAQCQSHDDVMFITQQGMIVRSRVDSISSMGRNTQGVRLVNLKPEDRLVALEIVTAQDLAAYGLSEPDEPEAGASNGQPSAS